MNKIAKILSAVISVTVALTIAVVMLTSAFAAAAPTLSLNVVSETADTVVLEVKLESGKFASIDFGVEYDSAKIAKCSKMTGCMDIAIAGATGGDASQAFNEATCLYSGAIASGYDKEGGVIATYTFDKKAAADISKDDFTLVVSNCTDTDNKSITASVVNKLPAAVVTTVSTTQSTTQKPTETTTQTTTQKPVETTTQTTTQKPVETTTETTVETTTETTVETTTETAVEITTGVVIERPTQGASSDEMTEVTVPTTGDADESTTEAPTEAPTEKPVDGEVVNPDTGDSVTATAAVFSLLAVSGAAIVALRKKED